MSGLLDAMFAGFAVGETAEPRVEEGHTLVCSVLGTAGGRAEVQVDGRVYRAERRDVVGLGYMMLFQATLRRIRSHLLLHAGALEHDGRGVLLVGDSGAGKSTLVMELVRRGFRLLSDDIGAIRLDDGLLEPFPRSLGFVPKTDGNHSLGAPTGIPAELQAPMPLIGGGEKLVVRPEAFQDRLGRPCEPALLIFLPGGPERSTTGDYLHVVFNDLSPELFQALDQLPELSDMQRVPNRLFPELRFPQP